MKKQFKPILSRKDLLIQDLKGYNILDSLELSKLNVIKGKKS